MPENQPRMLGMEFLVCREVGASPFDDDLVSDCADCGRPLTVRPYLVEQESKLCVPCFSARKQALRGARTAPV